MLINLTKNRTIYLFIGIRFVLLYVAWLGLWGWVDSIQVCAHVRVWIGVLTVRG